MQATEAMQHLLSFADRRLKKLEAGANSSAGISTDEANEVETLRLSTAVITAMLNTALPVARYRAFVEIPFKNFARQRSSSASEVKSDYTVCATSMEGIKAGLAGLYRHELEDIRIVIFEQRADGADMVEGFQGDVRSQNYRVWYRSLGREVKPN